MPEIRVGLLAYGAIGHEHNQAVQATPGLTLTAVCDTNPERIDAARELAPDLTGFTDAEEMLDSGLLDLVVVSTPPNSHHDWAMKALERDLHVVLEKPMALTADECDAALAFAADKVKTLVVYQNRRFDRDFITMRRLIREGSIGDVFQYDSFVGGYSRPCDYWHSDADVSGGAIFDWGSHYLDQVLNIFDAPIEHVSGMNHKRKWLHATNADHAEVIVTFIDGRQATFVHSDLAAARKPTGARMSAIVISQPSTCRRVCLRAHCAMICCAACTFKKVVFGIAGLMHLSTSGPKCRVLTGWRDWLACHQCA